MAAVSLDLLTNVVVRALPPQRTTATAPVLDSTPHWVPDPGRGSETILTVVRVPQELGSGSVPGGYFDPAVTAACRWRLSATEGN